MKKIFHQKFPGFIRFIFNLYIYPLLVLLLIRTFFVFYNLPEQISGLNLKKFFDLMTESIHFDLVPLTFVVGLVYIWMIFSDIYPVVFKKSWAGKIYFTGTALFFILELADTVYYHSFKTHITDAVLPWLRDPGTVFRMIFGSWHLAFMFIPGLLLLYLWHRKVRHIFKTGISVKWWNKKYVPYHLILMIVIFFMGKGRIIGHSLQSQNAFNDDLYFLNDFKLNAFFSIRDSWVSSRSHHFQLMDNESAIRRFREMFRISTNKYNSPVAREEIFDTTYTKPLNVVIILMERKAAWKMKYFGNTDNMTPFLDSLFLHSLSFDHFYSAGTRTFEGIFGSLYAHPILFTEHPLYGTANDLPSQRTYGKIKHFYGIPQVLKEKGYTTRFFCPHNPDFDNLITFLPANGFDKVYGLKDFDPHQKKTPWGVDDPALFDFALNKLDKLHAASRPFLGVILTITDHEPYYAPGFIKGKNIKIRAARYADWALKNFFKKARKKDWFNHTVFILFGDHGKPHNDKLPTPLSHHHVPLIIVAPGIKPQIIHRFGDQKDIFPTLMQILHISYVNNTLGKNLLDSSYSYAYFNHYQKAGWINDKYLVNIDNTGQITGLYDYNNDKTTNLKDSLPKTAQAMADSLRAHLQVSYYLRENNLQGKPTVIKQ